MARTPEVVLDASVVCKWFLPERDSRIALEIRDEHVEGRIRILAPDLMCFEVANTLRHRRGIGVDQLSGALRELFDVQLVFVRPSVELLSAASDHAYRKGLTIYDACYLALADASECSLVTADRKLLAASPNSVALSQWKSSG